jgi:hypothetical protein
MSDPVWAALIAGIPGIVAAVASAINLVRTGRLDTKVVETNNKITETNDKVTVTHDRMTSLEKNTNDKMDQLLQAKDALMEIRSKASYAEGVKAGETGQFVRGEKKG